MPDPSPRTLYRAALLISLVPISFSALTFASVPLYRMICEATGFGGFPRIEANAATPGYGTPAPWSMTVRFDASVNRDMPWLFRPAQATMRVRPGESMLAYFIAENPTDRPVSGTATFNVTPAKAARYVVKTHCFCFEEQTLAAGARVTMPVEFYVDPAIADDREAGDVRTVTLAYTFFRKGAPLRMESAR